MLESKTDSIKVKKIYKRDKEFKDRRIHSKYAVLKIPGKENLFLSKKDTKPRLQQGLNNYLGSKLTILTSKCIVFIIFNIKV